MSSSDLNEVRAAVAKVINFIVKRSALTHRQFQSLLEEMESNLALHSAREVAKLRKGFRAVCRLLRCIKAFLSTAGGRAVGGEELSSQRNISNAEICAYMRKLESEFTTRFGDFKGPMTCYFMYSLI